MYRTRFAFLQKLICIYGQLKISILRLSLLSVLKVERPNFKSKLTKNDSSDIELRERGE